MNVSNIRGTKMKRTSGKNIVKTWIIFVLFPPTFLQSPSTEQQSTDQAETSIAVTETTMNHSSSETSITWSPAENFSSATEDLGGFITDNENVLGGKSSSIIFSWNKSTMSAKTFQQSYCKYRCRNGELENIHNRECPDFECLQCECKKPECELYGICCPDVSEPVVLPWLENMESTNSDGTNGVEKVNINGFPENLWNNVTETTIINSDMEDTSTERSHEFPNPHEFHNSKDANSDGEFHKKGNSLLRETGAKIATGKVFCDEYLMIRSCPRDMNVAKDVLVKCESDIPIDEITVETIARVTDNSTNVVYYNKYCAECNGVTETVKWKVQIDCTDYLRVYSATTYDELLRMSMEVASNCKVTQQAPGESLPFQCLPNGYITDVIDKCNVTGLWHDYDEDVVEACANLTYSGYRVWHNDLTFSPVYQNIFCALCNTGSHLECSEYSSNMRIVAENSIAQKSPSPYGMLLGLRSRPVGRETTQRIGKCKHNEWSSPDDYCFPIQCSLGKVLTTDNCTTALSEISGLEYHVQMWLIPQIVNITVNTFTADTPSSGMLFKNLFSKLSETFEPFVARSKLHIGAVANRTQILESDTTSQGPTLLTLENSAESSQQNLVYMSIDTTTTAGTTMTSENMTTFDIHIPFLYWVSGFVIARTDISRDEFEQTFLDRLRENLEIEFSERVAVNLTPAMMWSESDPAAFCSDIKYNDTNIKCFSNEISIPLCVSDDECTRLHNFSLNLARTLTCRFIKFTASAYVVENRIKDFSPSIVVTLDLNVTKITFSSQSDLSQLSVDKNGVLSVCRELLKEKLPLENQSGVEPDKTDVQSILNLVCVGISMLCLLLTIVTYASFPVLRSVAGKNNMCLCASMLLSQASLLASYYTTGPSTLCTALGICTHFLWLCMFCWSFICCFHMYRVFTAKTRNSHVTSRSQYVLLIKNVFFSLLVPAIVVIAVVVAMYVTSQGGSIGYGEYSCYLDSVILVGVVMVGPILLITLCNIIFFLVAVAYIQKVRKLQHEHTDKKEDNQNLYVYAKLSTLTGAFWIVFILADAVRVDALSIIAIILNGFQGVFIFVSYICSRRVLHLYMSRLGYKREILSSTYTESSNLGRHTSKTSMSRTSISRVTESDKDEKSPGTKKQMLNDLRLEHERNERSNAVSSFSDIDHKLVPEHQDESLDLSAVVNPAYIAHNVGSEDEKI